MKDNENQIVSEIINFFSVLFPDFQAKYKRAEENINLVFDKHWTDEQIQRYRNKDRTEVNIPVLFQKVLALLGFEKENRNIINGEPKGKEDELVAEMVSKLFKDIQNSDEPTKYEFIRTDAFFDGVVPCYGAIKLYVESDDFGNNELKFKHIPYNEIIYDTNFTDYEREGCTRTQHHWWDYIDNLKLEFPDADFEKISADLSNKEIYPLVEKKNLYQEAKVTDENKTGRELCRRIDDYKRVIKTYYCVYDIKNEEKREFDTKKEAEAYVQGQIVSSIGTADMSQLGEMIAPVPQITESDFEIKATPKKVWQKTSIAGNVLLKQPEVLEVDEDPITIYFSLFTQGKHWTIIDIARDLQLYIDRLFSQVDYNIGTDVKTVFEVNATRLHVTNPPEKALKIMSSGGTVFTNSDNAVIRAVPKSGTHPQYFTIFETLLQLSEDIFGGRNFQGASESTDQSGRAIERLQAAASLMALNYMDNLRRFDLMLWKKVLKYIKKYYTHKFTLKVLGDEFTQKMLEALQSNKLYEASTTIDGVGYLIFNDGDKSKVSDANLSINISQISSRRNQDEIDFEKLVVMSERLKIPVPAEVLLSKVNIPATDKEKIKQAVEEQKAMQEKQLKFQALESQNKQLLEGAKVNTQAGQMEAGAISSNATQQNGVPE